MDELYKNSSENRADILNFGGENNAEPAKVEQNVIVQYSKSEPDDEGCQEVSEPQSEEERRDSEIEQLSADNGEFGELYRAKYKDYIKSKAQEIRELRNNDDALAINDTLDKIESEARNCAYKSVQNEKERTVVNDRLKAFERIINEE